MLWKGVKGNGKCRAGYGALDFSNRALDFGVWGLTIGQEVFSPKWGSEIPQRIFGRNKAVTAKPVRLARANQSCFLLLLHQLVAAKAVGAAHLQDY
jgi:hypothetical protein